MSAVYVAVGTAAVGIYSADRAASAAKKNAAAQKESAQMLAEQADRAAQLSYSLGRDQLAFAKQQYAEMAPLAKAVAASQIASQDELTRQGRDYYDYQVKTFRPLEQGLVADAERFNTEAYREQLASQAAADAARAFGTAQGITNRDLARRGVSPNSGAALARQNTLGLASMQTGAATGARQQAEQLGWARRLDAAGLGRNLANASVGAYSAGVNAGSAGVNSAMAPGNQYMQGMQSAANTMMAGSGQAMNAYGQLYSGANTAAMNAQNNYYGVLGGMVGMGGNIAAAKFGLG